MLITNLINFIFKLFNKTKESDSYGSALERYITSKNPQSTYDVEYWTRRFDEKISNKHSAGWSL